jgi:hypothetical protein
MESRKCAMLLMASMVLFHPETQWARMAWLQTDRKVFSNACTMWRRYCTKLAGIRGARRGPPRSVSALSDVLRMGQFPMPLYLASRIWP